MFLLWLGVLPALVASFNNPVLWNDLADLDVFRSTFSLLLPIPIPPPPSSSQTMGISIPSFKMGLMNLIDRLCTSKAPEHHVSFDLQTANQSSSSRRSIQLVDHSVHLPMEVVIGILEAAYYDDDLQANRALLLSCSLVCKDWCTTAQNFLFRDVTLRTQEAYRAFTRAVDPSTARGKMLGETVVRLHVSLDPNQPRQLRPQSFARAVTYCPNIYELQVTQYANHALQVDVDADRHRTPAPSFDAHTLSLLRAGPRITALRFDNWSEDSQAVSSLLDVYPSIQYLSISGTEPTRLPMPFTGALKELRMNFSSEPSIEFTDSLLLNSRGSLTALELEREPSTALLKHLVHYHGETLESVSVPVCGAFDHAIALKQCAKMRELRIESPWVSPMVFKHLPEGVEHIAIGVDAGTALQPVIDAVKSKEALKAVTVQVWEGGDAHPQFCTLKVACAFRGIELRTTRDVRVFREMIVSSSFLSPSFIYTCRCHSSLRFPEPRC
jgi:hypothetical protein